MAHRLPPKLCSTNAPTWTDDTLTADVTKVRKVHIDELRTYINAEFTRRGLATYTFTDATITADSTKVRKTHMDELRAAIELIHTGRGESGYCPEDTVTPSWTDATITADSTKVKAAHWTELGSTLESLMAGCVCETEQCQYCADCGYSYSGCTFTPCVCDNHKYSECGNNPYTVHLCGSTNLATGTAHPYKAYNRSPTAWDGYVPWNWCIYTPPGSNWGSCEHSGGHNHSSDWTCKCNPFTW